MAFELPKLSYAYEALEPNIDARTMEIHHTKHHQAYINNLNAALTGSADEGKSIEQLMANISKLPMAVRNNGGGHYNHSLFWEIMGPNAGGTPTGELADAINQAFELYSTFCSQVHIVEKPEIAEAAKLIENTFRQVNIALVNELSEVASKFDFSLHDAIRAAATKPFGFMPFYESL